MKTAGLLLCSALVLFGQSPTASGIRREYLDPGASPCLDLYQFANGGWIKHAVIPPAESRWGASEEVILRNEQTLHDIFEGFAHAKTPLADHDAQLLRAFYRSGMDLKAIEAADLAPLKPWFRRIDHIRDRTQLVEEIGRLNAEGFGAAWQTFVDLDARDSASYAFYLLQGGLTLPDRSFYLRTDPASKEILQHYRTHLQAMFSLAGETAERASRSAQEVLQLETRLAEASSPLEDTLDPIRNYHRLTRPEVDRLAQGLDLTPWFRRLELPPTQPMIVGQPEFAQAAFQLIQSAPLSTWKAYLRWVVLHTTAEALPARFYQENFAFFHRVLEGLTAPPERWRVVVKACVGDLNTAQPLGMAAGKFYVQRAFPPAAKAKILEMVENIRTAFAERIEQSTWMSAPTKAKALEKLKAMRVKMGYPDHWRDYSALQLGHQPFAANVLACLAFEARRSREELGHPLDRNEWLMVPSMRNAMYNPTLNDITFPAGFLQPPYFDPRADDAANYGAIGVVIGHEMTHGFDAGGRKYDAEGNLKDWWSPEDARVFEAKTRLLAEQYDQYEPLPGFHINGKATLSENIADLGGVEMAFRAWKNSLGGRPSPVLDGFTGEQRFFLGFAQAWRARFRETYLRTYLQQEVHSPARFRVLGSVRNVPEFQSAFACGATGSQPAGGQAVLTLW